MLAYISGVRTGGGEFGGTPLPPPPPLTIEKK